MRPNALGSFHAPPLTHGEISTDMEVVIVGGGGKTETWLVRTPFRETRGRGVHLLVEGKSPRGMRRRYRIITVTDLDSPFAVRANVVAPDGRHSARSPSGRLYLPKDIDINDLAGRAHDIDKCGRLLGERVLAQRLGLVAENLFSLPAYFSLSSKEFSASQRKIDGPLGIPEEQDFLSIDTQVCLRIGQCAQSLRALGRHLPSHREELGRIAKGLDRMGKNTEFPEGSPTERRLLKTVKRLTEIAFPPEAQQLPASDLSTSEGLGSSGGLVS